MSRLNTFVHVDGVAYGPDDEVPAEVAERITAPGVWAEEPARNQPTKKAPSSPPPST